MPGRERDHVCPPFKVFPFTITAGGLFMVISDIVALYVEIIREALPFVLVFWIGELIVTTFLRTAFSGRLSFKL